VAPIAAHVGIGDHLGHPLDEVLRRSGMNLPASSVAAFEPGPKEGLVGGAEDGGEFVGEFMGIASIGHI
jgi:hypothetical protein